MIEVGDLVRGKKTENGRSIMALRVQNQFARLEKLVSKIG